MKFLLLLLFPLVAQAHIPEYDTIMSRVAANHGSGTYQIQRLIKGSDAGTPWEVLETWTVGENGQMKVSLAGVGRLKEQIQGDIAYTLERKHLQLSGKGPTGAALPNAFAEHFLNLRSSKTLRSILVRLGMAPKESLENRASLGLTPTIKYKPQDFLSLARVEGAITYAVSNGQKPFFFIEQDQFVVSRAAFPSGPVMTAKDYQTYANTFYFPKTVIYTWGDKTVEATTQKVVAMGKGAASFGPSQPLTLPNLAPVVEFYSQFR